MKRYRRIIVLLVVVSAVSGRLRAEDRVQPMSLTQCITTALEQSTLVRSAREAVKSADYERKAARTDFFAKIGTQFSYTRFNEDPHSKTPAGGGLPNELDMKTGRKNRYQWDVYIEQPLFTGGRLHAAYGIARLGKNIADQHFSMARQDLILEAKTAYFSILKTEKIKQVALQAVRQVKTHVDVAQAFFEQEMIPKNDLLESYVRYAQVQQNLISADNGVQVAKTYFNTVLRRDVNEPAVVKDILDKTEKFLPLDAALDEALKNRPEVKESLYRHDQAENAVALAKSSFFPQVYLVADYRKMGDHPDLRGTPYEDPEMWTVSTMLTWDIWEWGKKKYRLGAYKARARQVHERKKRVADIVAFEVKKAWLYLVEAEKNITVAKSAVNYAQENFRLQKERYNEQMATTTDVLDAQTLLTQARTNHYNALSDYHVAKARLERAMGRIR